MSLLRLANVTIGVTALSVLISGSVLATDLSPAVVPAVASAAVPADLPDPRRVVAAAAAKPEPVRAAAKPAPPVKREQAAKRVAPTPKAVPHSHPKPAAPKGRPAAARTAPKAAPGPDNGCNGQGDWVQRRGQAAMKRLNYPIAGTGYTVKFLPARKGYLGMTRSGPKTIELYVRNCEREPDLYLTYVLAHEVGHVIDLTYGKDENRAAWLAYRNASDRSWWPTCQSGCSDFPYGAGDFAETFAYSRTGAARYFDSQVGPVPTKAQLRHLSQWFEPGNAA